MTKNLKIDPPLSREMALSGKFSLSTLKAAAKKALSPSTKEDYSVANALAAYHVDQTGILNRLGRFSKDGSGIEDSQEGQHFCNDHLGTNDNTLNIAGNEAATQLVCQKTLTQTARSFTSTVASSRVTLLPPIPKPPHQMISLPNVAKPIFRVVLPKSVSRIKLTPQLAFAHHLLPKKSPSPASMPGLVTVPEGDIQEMEFDETEEAWMAAIKKDPVEQGRVRWLATQLVTEFLKNTQKDLNSINEIVLLGPVLDREDYLSVLNSLTVQLENDQLFAFHLVQGLSQLLQDASPGYLIDDDLVRILRVLRQRLKDTFQSLGDYEQAASGHIYYLTRVVARVLDTMVDVNVKGLNRTEDHKTLLDILDKLKGSDDPYLNFQATYAMQALQYVGDDETPLHAVLRFGGGVVKAAVGVASILKFDLDNVFKGLQELGGAVEQAYDGVKSVIEGAGALRDGGEGVMDSMLEGFRSGRKRAWYPALQGARVLIHQGRLADFQRMIFEAPCRRVTEFQRGICQLLGEVAMDPIWAAETRQQTVALLGEMYGGDGPWSSDLSVKKDILGILQYISVSPEQNVQDLATGLLGYLTAGNTDRLPRPFPLVTRLSLPAASPLLAKVIKLPSIEYHLHRMMDQRIKEYEKTVFIPPFAKANLQAEDEESFPLLEKVLKFLQSDQQVFLILGDSGAGKSTFNKHLEHLLLKNYQHGARIPLFINLPTIKEPEKNLVEKQLKALDFSEDDILELKQDRQFTIICDGYDESQLLKNLHYTNSFNRSEKWDTKMIIGCRSTYLGHDYRDRFQPQPKDRYSPATPHLFQEAAIVPFSSDQTRNYVEQFVQEPKVHELFDGGQIWSVDEYMDKLKTIPNLKELVKNPFMLLLALRTLPAVTKGAKDLTDFKVTRLSLYQTFVHQWIHLGKLRLMSMKLERSEQKVQAALTGDGFSQAVVEFLEKFAAAIYCEQDGNPVVQFTERLDGKSWKAEFLSSDTEPTFKRDASPLTRAGDKYRFIHRSLLEYFYTFEEHEVHQLRNMRNSEHESTLFIPLQVMSGPQYLGDETFPLMDKVQSFLRSDRLVLLLLGDEGSGKTTFCRQLEWELLQSYKKSGPIPLHIDLSTVDNPKQDLISQGLRALRFSEDVIQKLVSTREFILICDGFDKKQLEVNLYESNRRYHSSQWRARMIITCNSAYLDQNYRQLFEPQHFNQVGTITSDLYEEYTLAPISRIQIQDSVEQYVPLELQTWTTKGYAAHLYDSFVGCWSSGCERRLMRLTLSEEVRNAFEELLEIGYISTSIEYSTQLALAIFEKQDGNPIVQYVHHKDKDTWKAAFFGPDPVTRLLQESSPMKRIGNEFQFLHRSILEYFLSRAIFNPHSHDVDVDDDICPQPGPDATPARFPATDGLLFKRNLITEPSIIQFLRDRVKQYSCFEKQLLGIIERSKTDATAATAAANAITILVRAGVHFSSANLRGIRIPGADLSNGQFDFAQFQGADLTGANFARSSLRQVDFGDAQMDGVQFEEQSPCLKE